MSEFKINKLFKELIKKIIPSDIDQILEEFELMRNTRNSLHDGGKYNSTFSYYKGKLCGKEYEFHPEQLVMPLRTMDVIQTIWFHYKNLEK